MLEAGQQQVTEPGYQCVDADGPWPFVTRRVFQAADHASRIWSSRHHRKGLRHREREGGRDAMARPIWRCLWMPSHLNWWIGAVFAIGSLLFVVGSALSLAPALFSSRALDSTRINVIFFAGSIPFTIAAYLQLFQAANVGDFLPNDGPADRLVLLGWRPHDAGWLSSALQFIGTLLFNFNTYDAMRPSLNWLHQDLEIWVPDFAGSVLFLLSGYLAYIEICHAHWAWKPSDISWWVAFINLLGCLGFMISALFAFVPPLGSSVVSASLATAFTLQGALCFLIGAFLLLPEAALKNAPSNVGQWKPPERKR
ncbi:hypothetical protein [Stieleria magnilauensis]|uniref:YrhK domain-containing protein n=1 Tax=Stieleria magnilauensis TaxID=2527963 RepID=A0ABX5XVN0_9BACT|nr:hypothetical protein TBK1r_47980 [Planctomycetes bacterium TBK1r]